MNKFIFPLIMAFLLTFTSCRTTKNTESSSMVENSEDSVSESIEEEQIDVTIEYPPYSDTHTPPTTAPKTSEDNKTKLSPRDNASKKTSIKIGDNLFPILPNSKIIISKSTHKTKKDSVHNNNIVKDDKSVKPKEDNKEVRQYGTLLVFFILFYCLVVSLRKKSP